jgi:Protein of unknown function (DUF1344)
MRKTAAILAAGALIGSISLAYAGTDTGVITDINQSKHSITLKDGSTFMAPKKANLSRFKVGERATVAYATRSGAKDATHISRAPGSDAGLGG